MTEARQKAEMAKKAARVLMTSTSPQRNEALLAMAQGLLDNVEAILEANGNDVVRAREEERSESYIDRLSLTRERIEGMAQGLRDVAAQPDPLGRIVSGSRLENGVVIEKITVPLGVVGMIYEARPNVTSDAAGLCLKAGNACVLRGGSTARESNMAIASVLADAVASTGLPRDCVCMIGSADREETEELMSLVGLVDVLIPRGGAGLINACVQNSKVPLIQTGTGVCHVFVERTADLQMAQRILVNAKCSRPSVCNAAETLLVDEGILQRIPDALCQLVQTLDDNGVRIHGDQSFVEAGHEVGVQVIPAEESDWSWEHGDLEISARLVSNVDGAIDHINSYGTHHSECIVTSDYAQSERFLNHVDAACVYVNASTRFSDGGVFGLGAEIGISTQKLHARGPMGVEALVTTKYLCRGNGQVRA